MKVKEKKKSSAMFNWRVATSNYNTYPVDLLPQPHFSSPAKMNNDWKSGFKLNFTLNMKRPHLKKKNHKLVQSKK